MSDSKLPPRRPEDLEIIRQGLDKPWLLPRLAEDYSRKYGELIRPIPYDLLPENLSTRDLVGRWAHQRTNGKVAPMLRSFTPAPEERPRPPYDSKIKEKVNSVLSEPANAKRSVLFIHHSYYHFYYLSRALRRRGWRAYCVSTEDPSSGNQAYYHGEDLHIWDDDPWNRRELQRDLFEIVKRQFKMVHFHGDDRMSLFESNYGNDLVRNGVPWDLLELKAHNVKIGHSISGCLTGQRPTLFNKVTKGVCDKCVWQGNGQVCSDEKSGHVNDKFIELLDLNAIEADWPIDTSRQTPQSYYDPLTYCYDPELWNPDLEIPDHIERLRRDDKEILVFHAVGNYSTRDSGARNIKGTPAVIAAVERLQAEGVPVRLVFKTGVPSKDMRFYQIQADIVVDQLNYGRWGATARETMALGLPTICHVERKQPGGVPASPALAECPLVEATEATVYDAIKDLALNPDKRRKVGLDSRDFAEKWFSADACAERFEKVYDRMMAGKRPLYPV